MTDAIHSQPKKSALTPSTIRIGKRYRANRLNGDYDAIIIGSGIGGLTAAASLASFGYKVVVFEQHYTAGGFTHSYCRNGYEWDVGVHYIGDVGVKTTLARRLFDFISNNQLQWQAMDSTYDRIYLGEDSFDLVAGRNNFRENLIKRFPEEKDAIDEYLFRLGRVADAMQHFTLERMLPNVVAKASRLVRERTMPDYFNRPTRQVLEELTSNQTLIAFLTGQWGDNGMPPAQSSFLIHALIAKHYLYGGYYPVGGASRMAETIIPQIQKTGGEVFTYAAVEQILIEQGKAVGVRMKDGTDVHAPIVISNAGVFNTFNRLLPSALVDKTPYAHRLQTVKPSMASLCLYIGLQDTSDNLQLPKTNLWIYPSERYEQDIDRFLADPKQDIPLVYISFPSAKDPTFNERYPNRATIEIVAPCPWEWVEQWADKPWGKRGADYDALKEQFSQRLLEKLYQKLPHLRGKIDYYELSTPLSTQFFCWYEKGEIYGLDHDPQRFEQNWLKPKTDIDGLYLTGQDVMTCGVVGAMIGGLMTAVTIGGLKALPLAKKIFVG
ncbi:phytoene desaturase family protein [Agitococcus lubricus]|uniref:Phytoene dehydrogenase-like protein n=1 Tax=Agitococcus lubricus TaxID=1077255 RepID=A0A2T5J3K0_9GAMM|nr:NAD(P)/FAD-dependent oxidoreductase [Agitococcus lubricus]PTQ91185.1 phytoene dehydrogenase-like protein [Agitococcus lubricus]